MAVKLAPYRQWKHDAPLRDPRDAPADELVESLASIVSVEGPMLQSLLNARYVAAVPDLSRAGRVVREALENGVATGQARGALTVDQELGKGAGEHAVVRVPGQPAVVARQRGDRSLDEISLSELAALFTLVRNSVGASQYTESVQRVLLHELGLVRLTSPAKQRLLLAWRIADAWQQAGVRDLAEATIPTQPLAGAGDQPAGTDMRGKRAAPRRRANVGATSLWDSYSLSARPKTTRRAADGKDDHEPRDR